jgi:hypothetical protein
MDLRVARPPALVVALALIGAPGVAHAEVIDLPDTRAELTLDTRTWHTTPTTSPGATSGLVYGAHTERERLAVTRAQIPNIDAWRAKTRDAYVEQIEKGLVAAGYKVSSKKLSTIEGVPVLDLEATPEKRTSNSKSSAESKTTESKATESKAIESKATESKSKREPIVMRVILFRTYALTLALEGPRSSRAALRAIAKSFVPPPARPEGSP